MLIQYNIIYKFIVKRCIELNIDESHAGKHSMDVLKYSQKILNEELKIDPNLIDKKHIIYTSAMLHDMCDGKYMDEKKGLDEIESFIKGINYEQNDIDIILKIINTMSYSKVKKDGFPNLGENQKLYHIVREADLLTGYDIERCIVYGIIGRNMEYIESCKASKELYFIRMAKQIENNLFTTKFGIEEATKLDKENKERIIELDDLLDDY